MRHGMAERPAKAATRARHQARPAPAPERAPTDRDGGDAPAVAELSRAAALAALEPPRSGRLRWWRAWSWLTLTAAGVAAYALVVAYGDGSVPARMLDGLKLFPSGFPGNDPSVAWPYLLGRHLGALVSLFVTLRIVFLVFADRLAQLRARGRRRHAVVCGLGEKGLRSTRALRAAGIPVTCLELDPSGDEADAARNLGAVVLRADATQLVALRIAATRRAHYVVCTCGRDGTNARIASLVAGLARGYGRRQQVHVHLRDPELVQSLRAPAFSLGDVRLHFFDVTAVWARALLEDARGPLSRLETSAPRLAVLGATPLGTAVLLGAARRWHERARAVAVEDRAMLALVDPDAANACAALADRYPALRRSCELVAVCEAPSGRWHSPLVAALGGAPDGVYACLADPSANLTAALHAERESIVDVPVLVPASTTVADLGPLLVGSGDVHFIRLPTAADSLELLHDDMRDALARALHDRYVADRRARAGFGSRPGDVSWESLDEELREANRRHVDAMVEQLRALWYDVEPRYDWDEPPLELDPGAVEVLAELEHERWRGERDRGGWRYGSPRDDAAKTHDLLVPWVELAEPARDLARGLVRARPQLLAQAGYRLRRARVREALARQVHADYVAARHAAGESPPLALPWEELPEEARERSRATVDEIALKLGRTGLRAVPHALAPGVSATLAPAELELLATLEHERWLAERRDDGWTQGPRDDAARSHPSLVPWSELTESEREKDRDIVRAIPALLRRAGYTLVRDTAAPRAAGTS